jgi:hypothetical protein
MDANVYLATLQHLMPPAEVPLIREVQCVRCVRLNSTITRVMFAILNRLELPSWPSAGAVEQLPMRKNERSNREVANEDFVSNVLVASKVVTNIELKSIAPDFPKLNGSKQCGEASAPPGNEGHGRLRGHFLTPNAIAQPARDFARSAAAICWALRCTSTKA